MDGIFFATSCVCFMFYITSVTSSLVSLGGKNVLNVRYTTKTWLEVGPLTALTDSWTSMTSQYDKFIDPHVFISVMTDGDERLISDNYIVCPRIKDVNRVTGGHISFAVKLVQPNDSWCNYTWWTPTGKKSQDLFYLIMEAGHYQIEGAEFDIGHYNGFTHCRQSFYRYIWKTDFATGTYPAVLAQHQTNADPRFVTFRLNNVNINNHAASIFIQLHNLDVKWRPRTGDCIDFHWGDHYDNHRWRQSYTTTNEKIGVLGYLPYHTGNCTSCEGIAFEAHEVDGITSDPRWVPFFWEYKEPPGVFGMFQSFYGGDTVIVRSFNHSKIGVGVIAREDQCSKQSIIHVEGERMGFFVVGPNNYRWSPERVYDLAHPWILDYSKGTQCCFIKPSNPCFKETPKTSCSETPFVTLSKASVPGLNVTYCETACQHNSQCTAMVYTTSLSPKSDTCSMYVSCTPKIDAASALFKYTCAPSATPTAAPNSIVAPINVPVPVPTTVPVLVPASLPVLVPTTLPVLVPTASPTENCFPPKPNKMCSNTPTKTTPDVTLATCRQACVKSNTCITIGFVISNPSTNTGTCSLFDACTPVSYNSSVIYPYTCRDCFVVDSNMMCSGTAKKVIYSRTVSETECKNLCKISGTCQTAGYSYDTASGYANCSLFDKCEAPVYTPGTDNFNYNRFYCPRPKQCVSLIIADLFGAPCCSKAKDQSAWGGARLFQYDSSGLYSTYAPTCEENPMSFNYCFDPDTVEDGAYVIYIIHGYVIEFRNEIFFQAFLPWDGSLYTGGWNTIMKFVTKRVEVDGVGQWVIALSDDSQNILPNKAECNSLMVDSGNGKKKACPLPQAPAPPKVIPPPPPAPSDKEDKEDKKVKEDKDKNIDGEKVVPDDKVVVENAGQQKGALYGPNLITDGFAARYGPFESKNYVPVTGKLLLPVLAPTAAVPRRKLSDWYGEVVMDGHNSTWFEDAGVGARYAIANDAMDILYYVGTMCDGTTGAPCLNLQPGCYIYRVDGMFDPHADDIEWQFCGVKGSYSSQLPFCITAAGDCVPGEITRWDELCANVVQSWETDVALLSGTVLLGGVDHSQLSKDERAVIQSALNQEFSDAATHGEAGDAFELGIAIHNSQPAPRRPDTLALVTNVTFHARVHVQRFGGYAKIGPEMKLYLSKSMSSGLFAAKVVHLAHSINSKNLLSLRFAKLTELTVTHDSEINQDMSSIANTVIIIGAVVGIAFGLLIFRKVQKGGRTHAPLPLSEL